jgi:cell division GTPase FtsZ
MIFYLLLSKLIFRLNEAFIKADASVAAAILGIAEILRCGNLISTDFADLKELLGGKKSLCHIGFGLSDDPQIEDRCSDAAEKLLQSPLLGGKKSLEICRCNGYNRNRWR